MAVKSKKRKTKAAKVLRKKHRSEDSEPSYSGNWISTIILIFFAIFVTLSNFRLGGSIGDIVRDIVMSLFGQFGNLFPIIILASVVMSFFYKGKILNVKIYGIIILYIMAICIVETAFNNYDAASDFMQTLSENIENGRVYSEYFDSERFSGGIFGTSISLIACKAIGKLASIVTFSVIALISFILIFGTKLPMHIAVFFRSIFSFIFGLPKRLSVRREEDRQIALDNEKILKEAYEKSKKSNIQVSFDSKIPSSRLVLEPMDIRKKTFDTSKVTVTPEDISSHLYSAKKENQDIDRPQSHLLKELRKKSINEVIYEEKEKGNTDSRFFYTEGMKPIDELDSLILSKPKVESANDSEVYKNVYDEDTSDSVYNVDEKSFASGLEELNRETPIVKDDSKKTLSNIEKDGIEIKNDTLPKNDITITRKKRIKKYKFPPTSILEKSDRHAVTKDPNLNEKGMILVDTLKTFGIGATLLNITVGPAVTRYELRPDIGVKISKILSLENDLQLALAASSLKIEAPIPGKAAIGIEIANEKSTGVLLGDIIASPEFRNAESKLTVAIGKDISGKNIITDLRKMPHLLIAGATGSGKSVCVNSIITSLIYKSSPEDVRMIMVDPKVVELQVYDGIPHLLIPVVTNMKKAAGALSWAVSEMTRRYNLIQEKRVRDIESYNQAIKMEQSRQSVSVDGDTNAEESKKLPYIVIIIDEFADLMMVASKEVENSIMRIAQLARACGIYLVIATQRPSVNVISGSIKTNVPSRISFAVSSGTDSQVVLDRRGAEKLLGHGDMLYFPQGIPEPVRVQGAYVSEDEVLETVNYIKDDTMEYDENIEKSIENGPISESTGSADGDEKDERFVEIGRFIVERQEASIGMIQRKFAMGFNRAARIIDQLESEGVISRQEGKKQREVLMTIDEFNAKFGG